MNYCVHSLPGRLRLRIPKVRNNPQKGAQIKAVLEEIEGVERVSVSSVTGSLVVNYDSYVLWPWQILQVLKENNFIDGAKPIANNHNGGSGFSKAGGAVSRAIFGWAIGKAFEQRGLSFLSPFV